MDTPGELRAFVRSVELGGFSAAARDLELTPSALSKIVTRLEDRLGVRLLNRTTRLLALTPEGEAFFERTKQILADIEEAEAEVTRFGQHPRGLLRVNVSVAVGLHALSPALAIFLARYPEIEVELTMTDRLVDVVEEGVDVAIRSGVLADSNLIGRKICDLQRVICASPAYLKKHGTPKTPEDLLKHNCMTISNTPALRRWPFLSKSSKSKNGSQLLEVHGNATANNAESLLQFAVQGMGIIRLVDVIVGESIQKGLLVPLLTDAHHVEPLPLSAVYPPGRHRSPRVAVFVSFLQEQFGSAPWRPK